jgi:arsenite methyltransferase
VRIAEKPESREPISAWAPGRGIEDYIVSASIEARKPVPGEAASCCAPS